VTTIESAFSKATFPSEDPLPAFKYIEPPTAVVVLISPLPAVIVIAPGVAVFPEASPAIKEIVPPF